MSEQVKSLVPTLRFPEFKNDEKWEFMPIGNKVDLLSGYPFTSAEISENSKGIPLMRGINITEGFVRHSQEIDRFYLGETSELEKYRVRTNDLVIGMDGSKVGKNSALITNPDEGALLIQRVARLRTACVTTIRFIFQHINSTRFHSYVDRINTSGGIPHISAKQINDFAIHFPVKIEEQQKIADCLSSLDDLITAQNQKVEALKQYKKGLMQQLFPAEGETLPKLRFPEFENDGEWFETALEDCLDYLQPTPYLVADTNYNDAYKTPVLTAGKTFILGYTNENEGVFSENLPVIIFDDFTTATQFVDFPFKAKSSAMKILLAKNGANVKFMYELLQIVRFEVGAHERHWISTFAPMKVLVPSPEEQSAIANFLSSIDELISIQTQQLEAYKTLKKGLMQQLFPSLDGV